MHLETPWDRWRYCVPYQVRHWALVVRDHLCRIARYKVAGSLEREAFVRSSAGSLGRALHEWAGSGLRQTGAGGNGRKRWNMRNLWRGSGARWTTMTAGWDEIGSTGPKGCDGMSEAVCNCKGCETTWGCYCYIKLM
jgi:hypothetical protein